MKTIRIIVAVIATTALGACSKLPESPLAAILDIDQAKLCQVNSWHLADQTCKLGQKIVFLPESWGNEQLPILFTALNCDLRFQVVATKGAVACIFKPIEREAAAPQQSKPAASRASK